MGISLGFWLIPEGNDISNTQSKFQDHTRKNLFKMAIFQFTCVFNDEVVTTPRTQRLWRLTLALGKVLPPICFHQNDRKGCRIDYLGGLGHFLGFWATGKNLPLPLVRRGLKKKQLHYARHICFLYQNIFCSRHHLAV